MITNRCGNIVYFTVQIILYSQFKSSFFIRLLGDNPRPCAELRDLNSLSLKYIGIRKIKNIERNITFYMIKDPRNCVCLYKLSFDVFFKLVYLFCYFEV